MDAIAKTDIDFLLVFMVDRIGRFASPKDRNRVIELLEESKTSVDSPYDGLFRYDNEKEMNNLEALLNESRADNVRRGRRIKEGHLEQRLNGRVTGGSVPFGVHRFTKEEIKQGLPANGFYCIVPGEYETLKVIFEKLSTGWGLQKTADYLNQHLDKYPKRPRRYGGRVVGEWVAAGLNHIAMNNFFFTGVIPGDPPVDTGLRLFDRETIEIARREMRSRRLRSFDPKYKNRKRTHSQVGTTVFTDGLLKDFIYCGLCGRKLSFVPTRPHGREYLYYHCRAVDKKKCTLKRITAPKLDSIVYRKFVGMLKNPEEMQKRILKEEFLISKDREEQEASLSKAIEKFAKNK